MKRRVLLIDLGANFGGVESYLVSLTRLLATELDLYVLCVLPELKTRLSGCWSQGNPIAGLSRSVETTSIHYGHDCFATAACCAIASRRCSSTGFLKAS